MKKIFLFFVTSLFLISCHHVDPNKDYKVHMSTSSEYSGNTINITYNNSDESYELKYQKIKIDNHDFWIRTWETKYGTGSDLKHFPELCDYCKH